VCGALTHRFAVPLSQMERAVFLDDRKGMNLFSEFIFLDIVELGSYYRPIARKEVIHADRQLP